jgi:hypothetical protein
MSRGVAWTWIGGCVVNKRFAGSVLGACAAVSLCACGSSGSPSSSSSAAPTLGQEYPAIKAAVQSADSVRVIGTVSNNGTAESLNMVVTRSGELSGQAGEAGKNFTILLTGGKAYIKVTKPFLKVAGLPASDCSSLCGKWVVAPSGTASQLTSNVTMRRLVGSLFRKAPTGAEANQRMKSATYQGQAAWSAHGEGATLYVASTGKPYLLGVVKGSQSVRFTDWNSATVPGPPPASDIVRP